MIRVRSPVWLAQPGRFASLRPGHALLGVVLILAALIAVLATHGGRTVATGDPSLQTAMVEGVRAGGDYYSVTAQALRAAGDPLKPVFVFRLPTLTVVQAALPDLIGILLLIAIAAATALAWTRRIAAWLTAPAGRIVALAVLAGGIVAVVRPDAIRAHDVWAGLLIAWAMAIRRDDRWVEAAAIGLCAMLVRETAAIPVLAMLAAAMVERRRREAIGWGAALAVFVAVLTLHARAAALTAGPLDLAAPPWAGLFGPAGVVDALAQASILHPLPWWIGAPAALLALAGWFAAPGPLGRRMAWAFGGVALAAVLIGPDGGGWVAIVAPVFPVGLAFLPDAARDLWRAVLDRRRVRVQRITR